MGAGYTRQSAADIIDNATIEAIDHNAEFNALESAFSGSTGHSHDGTLGEGPKIDLTTAVTGVLPIANGGTGVSSSEGNQSTLDFLFDGTTFVEDDKFFIADPADNTKVVRFDVGNFSTATVRTVTLPNADVTISAFAATFLDDVDAAAVRTTLGVPEIDADLTAISGLSGTGFPVRTGTETWALRSISGTTNQITVNNGNGVSGNVTLSLPSSVTISGTMTAGNFSTSGTFTGTFSGNGSAVTNLNASNLASGTVPSARLPTQSQSAWSAGTSTTESAISPAKLSASVSSLGTPPGVIFPYAGSSAPGGFLMCNGQAVSRTTYATLYSVIGTTYGAGNGSTTFNVPDLRGRVPAGTNSLGGSDSNRLSNTFNSLGGTGGVYSTTISSSNLPAHTHPFSATSSSSGSHNHSVSGSISGSTNTTGNHLHYSAYGANAAGGQGATSNVNSGNTLYTHWRSLGSQNETTVYSYSLYGTSATPNANRTNTTGNHSHTVSGTFSGSASTVGNHTHSVSGTTGSAGSGTALTIIQPTIAVSYIIKY